VPQQPETAGAPLKAAWYHCECLFEAFKRTSYRTNALTDLCEIDLVGDEGGLRDEVALKVGAQLVLHRQWLDGVEEEKSRQEGLAYEMWYFLPRLLPQTAGRPRQSPPPPRQRARST